MKTKLIYLTNSNLSEYQAEFLKQDHDETGSYIILDSTIFYPQGGGQPADQGFINISGYNIPIHQVKLINDEVRHYTKDFHPLSRGEKAHCHIDQHKRLTHTRLHTAGHLVSNIMGQLYPHWIAIKGYHFPDGAFVEFMSRNSLDEINLNLIEVEINKAITANLKLELLIISADKLAQYCPSLPYSIPSEQEIRLIRIGDYSFQPCGGTHLQYLNELKNVRLIKCNIKNERLKIKYEIN